MVETKKSFVSHIRGRSDLTDSLYILNTVPKVVRYMAVLYIVILCNASAWMERLRSRSNLGEISRLQ